MALKDEFDADMVMIYKRALKEVHYPAHRFLHMIMEQGGVTTARTLLAKSDVSDGFTALYRANRLDLSMEALVLQEKYAPLFTPEERQIATQRLRELERKE
jgi:hypothetical protein